MAKITLKSMPTGMDVNDYTAAITALALLHRQAKLQAVSEPYLGICFNWKDNLSEFERTHICPYNLVTLLAMDWPLSRFPGMRDCTPIDPIGPKWEGEGLRHRLSLITYMLGRLRSFRKQLREQEERKSLNDTGIRQRVTGN